MSEQKPWNPKEATEKIREMARSPELGLVYKLHAMERLNERSLIVSDILFALRNGFVHAEATPSTRNGYHKYAMESRTPNSGGREVRVVLVPDYATCGMKIVTVMWVDELATAAGSLTEERK